MSLDRRRVLLAAPLLWASSLPTGRALAAGRPKIEVFKNASCGCCSGWIAHLKKHGFAVTATDVVDLEPIKRRERVPDALASCHTALMSGYVIEGHVPAEAIDRLLAQRPEVIGIAVPGMPLWSPGMEAPGSPREPFRVMTIPKAGTPTVFFDYPEGYRGA